MPEASHPLPHLDDGLVCDCPPKGWRSLPEQKLDGNHWTVPVASQVLGIPLDDLKALIRIAGVQPSGTAKMAAYRRSGRQPRVYLATDLITLSEALVALRRELDIPDPC